jgi:hypothetical protein
MRTFTTLSCTLLALAFACTDPGPDPKTTTESDPAPAISKALLGTWETVELETSYTTYQGQDTAFHLLIREADWQRRYGVRPARTLYTPDGKLRRTHYNSAGQVTDVTNGLWKARGTDSLFVIEPNITLSYRHQLEGDRLTLTGLVDGDFDGEVDDDYRAVLRLVSRTDQ